MRRQHLTLLFTDLSGSTALGRGLEMEEYHELLSRLRAQWHAVAARYGGMVVRTQGDGALLVFGHERPDELDGLHAVEAALAIHAAVESLQAGQAKPLSGPRGGLRAHSGIHAGVVLIEEGDLERGHFDVVGDIANTAAKLQALAGPGEIVASLAALGLHAGLLHHELVSETEAADLLAGTTGDQHKLVRVFGRTAATRRFDASALRGLTPLLGRADLLSRLTDFLHAETLDSPRCALLTASVGMGKTRLLEELIPVVEGRVVLRGTCEQTTDAEVLQPFAQMVRRLPEHLGATLPSEFIPDASEPPSVGRYEALFTEIAMRHPVALVIDDWQWADDASRRLLRALLDQPLPLRAVVAGRPQNDGTPWLAEALPLTLRPLTSAESAEAVRRWLPDADPFLAERIHAHAGGVPLFIEEVCHATTSGVLAQSLDGMKVPRPGWVATLIASRLMALPVPALALVRTAAVIGHSAPLQLLSAATGHAPEADLLKTLSAADLLHLDVSGQAVSFKHGLTREAVYSTIGLVERRSLHRRILAALRADSAGVSSSLPETLAHHSWGAGLWVDTVVHAETAGDRATQAYALDLARAFYRLAIDATERLPDPSPAQLARGCRLAHKLGMACVFDPLSIGDGTAVFERALAVSRELADPALEARCLYWLGYVEYALGRYLAGRGHMRAALVLARELADAPLAAQVEAALGEILHATCEYDEAIALIDKAVAAKRERARPGGGVAVGSAYALACKGSMLADRGDFEAAWPCFDEAMRLLGNSSHPVGNSVRNWYAVACIWAEQWDRAERIASDSVKIAEHSRALLLLAIARSTLGYARWRRGDGAAALGLLQEAVSWLATRGGRMFTSLHFGWLAEACVSQGRTRQARDLTAHVLRRARQGERLGEAIAARAMARAERAASRLDHARRWSDRARQAAQARGSVRERDLNTRMDADLR